MFMAAVTWSDCSDHKWWDTDPLSLRMARPDHHGANFGRSRVAPEWLIGRTEDCSTHKLSLYWSL
jgi:hypothetical protein